jgi:hypothetical protein
MAIIPWQRSQGTAAPLMGNQLGDLSRLLAK